METKETVVPAMANSFSSTVNSLSFTSSCGSILLLISIEKGERAVFVSSFVSLYPVEALNFLLECSHDVSNGRNLRKGGSVNPIRFARKEAVRSLFQVKVERA